MGTAVFFHAHPDDEALTTGGAMARASSEGHRVVLVLATSGELGESPEDLAPGVTLVEHRRVETQASADVLGVHRVEWLGYRDSGMTGWPDNEHPDSFWRADVDVAAARLATILRDETADVLVTYDWHGGYGHPDHVQVHRVGHRAAALAATPRILEATYNRDRMRTMIEGADIPDGEEDDFDIDHGDDGNPVGTPESEISLAIDVSDHVAAKHRAIACHASQTSDAGFFAAMPAEEFAAVFSTEWYIEPGAPVAPAGPRPGWLFDEG